MFAEFQIALIRFFSHETLVAVILMKLNCINLKINLSIMVSCLRRLVVRTGRCSRPDEGSILSGDMFFY